jgi:hypothetical protein
VERVVKLRREKQALLTAPTESRLTRFLQWAARKSSPNTNENFGPSLVAEVVQMLYPNFPHALVQS